MPEAGFDYFTTQAHHRSLASRILTVLGAFNVVVVTADRLSGGPMVCAALSEAAAGRYMVIGFPCEPDIDRHDVLRFRASLSESLPVGSTADRGSEAPPLIVFYDTDRYSDKQIEELFSYIDQRTQIGDHRIMAAVFLASTEFLDRLEQPMLRAWLAKRLLVARLRFHELGADEIQAFIHHQLPPSDAEKIFTDEAIAAIANVCGGDPVVVNRFSRRILDCTAAITSNTVGRTNLRSAVMARDVPTEERAATTSPERPQPNYTVLEGDVKLPTRTWRDRSSRLKLVAGIASCFACVGVVAAVAFIRPAAEDVATSRTTRGADASAKPPEQGLLPARAPPDPQTMSTAEEPKTVARQAPLPPIAVPGAPTSEDALAIKMPALSQPVAPLGPTAELPTPKETAGTEVDTGLSAAATTETPPLPTVGPTTVMQVSRLAPSAPDPLPAQPPLPATEIAALVKRGDALFARGDVSSARLFYERAADAGEGRAALKLGNTFDPVFLEFSHLRMQGDSVLADSWYRRARELGEAEAEILLSRPPASSR